LANLSDLIISCLKLVKNTEHLYRPQADPFEFPDSFCLDVPENAGSYSSLSCPQNPYPEIPKLIRITWPPPLPPPATRESRAEPSPSPLWWVLLPQVKRTFGSALVKLLVRPLNWYQSL
jgi:hypothetical protein